MPIKSIVNGNAFNHTPSNNLWLKLWKSSELNTNYSIHKFDVISIMFAIHYLFESKTTFDNLIDNIDGNLKNNGYFIGTCLDGKKVFDLFNQESKQQNDYITGEKDGKIIWKIKKKYSNQEFNANESSLGMSIGVYISSINQEITEYLVNFDYLVEKLKEKNIVLLTDDECKQLVLPQNKSTATFDVVYDDMVKEVAGKTNSYTKSYKLKENIVKNLHDAEKKISFLSRYFIFKKQSLDEIKSTDIYNFIKLRISDKNYKTILNKKDIKYDVLKKLVDKEYGSIISTSIWELVCKEIVKGLYSKDIEFTKPKAVVKKTQEETSSKPSGTTKTFKIKPKSKVTELDLIKLKTEFNRFYPLIKTRIDNEHIVKDDTKSAQFIKILKAFTSKFIDLKSDPNFIKEYAVVMDVLKSLQ